MKHISISHHRGTDLLVAVHFVLLFEGSHSIQSCGKGCTDLQFIIDEKVDIFLNRLFVDDIGTIVLIIGILKLGTRHRQTVDSHHHRITLGECQGSHHSQDGSKNCTFHQSLGLE